MKSFFILVFIVLIQKFSFAQDTTRVRFRITTLPTQFLFYDFPLTVEKIFNRETIGLTLSYRPSTQNRGEIQGATGVLGYYLEQNFFNHMYNGITVGLNSKYYLSEKKKFFLDAELFYRQWWFENKNCHFDNVEGYRFNATRTERQNVYGMKFLFGNSFLIKTKCKVRPIIDLYCGIGVRYKTYSFETFNGTVDDTNYTYKKETGNSWSSDNRTSVVGPVSLQAGVKIGIAR